MTNRIAVPTFSEAELADYSLERAVQVAGGLLEGPSLEREISDSLAAVLSGRVARGDFFVPVEIGAGPLTSTTPGGGRELVMTRPAPFIDRLRARSVTAGLGATIVTDLALPSEIPRQVGAAQAYWTAEDPGADTPESDPTYDGVPIGLHTLTATAVYSRQLEAQSRSSRFIETTLREDLAATFGTAWDQAALTGRGIENEPRGLLNTSGTTPIPGSGVPDWDRVLALEEAVALEDAEVGPLGFAATPQLRRAMKQVEKAAGNGFVWESDRIDGKPALASTQVPTDAGAGDEGHPLIYGNWSDLVIAMLPAMSFVVDPYRFKRRGLIEITPFWFGDIVVRSPESFAINATATPAS